MMLFTVDEYEAKPPCRGCKERAILCHDSCQRYAEFKSKIEAERQAHISEKQKWEAGRPLRKMR